MHDPGFKQLEAEDHSRLSPNKKRRGPLSNKVTKCSRRGNKLLRRAGYTLLSMAELI